MSVHVHRDRRAHLTQASAMWNTPAARAAWGPACKCSSPASRRRSI